jgi:hypothetical protein
LENTSINLPDLRPRAKGKIERPHLCFEERLPALFDADNVLELHSANGLRQYTTGLPAVVGSAIGDLLIFHTEDVRAKRGLEFGLN